MNSLQIGPETRRRRDRDRNRTDLLLRHEPRDVLRTSKNRNRKPKLLPNLEPLAMAIHRSCHTYPLFRSRDSLKKLLWMGDGNGTGTGTEIPIFGFNIHSVVLLLPNPGIRTTGVWYENGSMPAMSTSGLSYIGRPACICLYLLILIIIISLCSPSRSQCC